MSFDVNYNMYSYKPIVSTQVSNQRNDKSKENQKSTDVISPNHPNKTKNSKVSIFYINDVHGQIPRMEQLTSAAMAHDLYVKSNDIKSYIDLISDAKK